MAKKKKAADAPQDKKVFGDPVYGPEDDIYSHEKRQSIKTDDGSALDKGLDIPGEELDDENEIIGEEDEENNYYSIGGDEHNDLEEDKDE